MVYAVRGNHDCEFDYSREIGLSNMYSNWYMPNVYYKHEFNIGNGKRFGMLHIDSCLMLCANFTYDSGHNDSPPDSDCSEEQIEWGNL